MESNFDRTNRETPASWGGQFTTTHWSVVRRAGAEDSQGRATALEQLCRVYWYPAYWFIRRQRNCNHHDAEDLTQIFFAHLLEKETLTRADREQGRFRTFLLGALKHILANEWDKKQAAKRGGRIPHISIDEAAAEKFFGAEPAIKETPDIHFDKLWAASLLRQALARLENEYAENNDLKSFAALQPALTDGLEENFYPTVAAKMNKTEEAVRVAVHRLRKRFRELLRHEVAQTLESNSELDAELKHLVRLLSGE